MNTIEKQGKLRIIREGPEIRLTIHSDDWARSVVPILDGKARGGTVRETTTGRQWVISSVNDHVRFDAPGSSALWIGIEELRRLREPVRKWTVGRIYVEATFWPFTHIVRWLRSKLWL